MLGSWHSLPQHRFEIARLPLCRTHNLSTPDAALGLRHRNHAGPGVKPSLLVAPRTPGCSSSAPRAAGGRGVCSLRCRHLALGTRNTISITTSTSVTMPFQDLIWTSESHLASANANTRAHEA
eukprot:1574454-Rhodomonas_salina.2